MEVRSLTSTISLLAHILLVCTGSLVAEVDHEKPKGRILVYPHGPCFHSAVFHMERMAALLGDSGYNVTVLVSRDFKPKVPVNRNVNYAVFDAPGPEFKVQCNYTPPVSLSSLIELVKLAHSSSRAYCESLLRSPLAKTLGTENFDLVIVDDFDLCSTVVASLISAPFMTAINHALPVVSDEFARYRHIPTVLSQFPMTLIDYPMTFGHRTLNFLGHLIQLSVIRVMTTSDFQDLMVKYGVRPELRVTSLLEQSALNLRFMDRRMDYPRPTYAHELEMAFLFPSLTPQKLDQAIMDFIGQDEVMLVSFGTSTLAPTLKTINTMVDCFESLRIKVIWKLQPELKPDRVPSNVLLLPWIPQTELLASGKVRLFLTHGGLASLSESVYFGVPMIICPMSSDQHTNAYKMENYFKVGKTVDQETLAKSKELMAVITSLWDTESDTRTRVEILGSQIRNDPDRPRDKLLYWVNELVSRKGVDLELVKPKRPAPMNLLQWLSLDVMTFLLVVFLIFSIIIIYVSVKVVGKLVSLFR